MHKLLASMTVLVPTLVGVVAAATPPPAKESPFACNRLGLTPAERKRHFEELGPQLRDARKGVRELSDGYEFAFPADDATWAKVTEWTMQERKCCPFFTLTVRLDREGGGLYLSLTGREGVKDFIRAEGAAWL